MDAVIYLRDCIFDEDCDCELNIETDLQERTLWFRKDDVESYKFNLDLQTPLTSPTTNQPFTLYQLYVFTEYLKERDWADYVMEVGLAQEDGENNGHTVEPIADSANSVCDDLYNYLKGNKHIFNGLSVKTQSPQRLHIMTHKRKREMLDIDGQDTSITAGHQPPHKKTKYDQNDANDNSNHNAFLQTNNRNDSLSLFTEQYDVSAIDRGDNGIDLDKHGSQPFWMTLPEPMSNIRATDQEERINWREDYRKRIRESATRNTILNSLNGKTFGQVAKEFPKISKSLQKLMNGGAKDVKPKFLLSQEEKTRRSRTEKPIIIVPYSNNSLLSFSNCLQFLQHSQFMEPSQSLHQQMHKKTKSEKDKGIVFEKKSKLNAKSNKKAVFEIRSSASFKKDTPLEEWNRIVAIFVIGKSWQFKKWMPGWTQPEKIFNKTAGFYMHYKDDPPKGEVKDWRVHYLPVMRNARHDDPRIYNEFWKTVHEHLRTKHKNKKLFF
eukprot:222861_1